MGFMESEVVWEWCKYVWDSNSYQFRMVNLEFENDVNMYGIQTSGFGGIESYLFENDVNMYGIQTRLSTARVSLLFENDVNMYGIQTLIVTI